MDKEQQRLIANRYLLLEEVGRGGFGTVWRAFDSLLEVQVALKQINSGGRLSVDERRTIDVRLRREAKISAALRDCTYTVRTLDVIPGAGDDSWIVMEYFPSRSLRQVLDQEQRLSCYEIAVVGVSVLSALVEMHSMGFIHRDITPANILLGFDGSVKLADFGLALGETDQRVTQGTPGTPGYVAPELTKGASPQPRSDLYSLGFTLFEAAKGSPPDIESLSSADFSEFGEIASTIAGLLASSPNERPTSSEALATLNHFLESTDAKQSVSDSDPEGKGPDSIRFQEYRINRFVLATLAAVSIACGVGTLLHVAHRPVPVPEQITPLSIAGFAVILGLCIAWRALEPTGFLLFDTDCIWIRRGWRSYRVHWSRIDRVRISANKMNLMLVESEIPLDLSEFRGRWQLPRMNVRTGILTLCRISTLRGANPDAIEHAVSIFQWNG